MTGKMILPYLVAATLCCPVAAQTSLAVNRIVWIQATDTGAANCSALRTVLGQIAGTPRFEGNDYLVKLEPGTYACGTSTVFLPSYVTLEGAGENTTRVLGFPDDAKTGVIAIEDSRNAAIRSMSIAHFGSPAGAVAVSIVDSGNILLDQVRLQAPSASSKNVALWVGSVTAVNTRVTVRDSFLSGFIGVRTEELSTGNVTADLISTQLVPDPAIDVALGGGVRCVGCFNGVLTSVDLNCALPPP